MMKQIKAAMKWGGNVFAYHYKRSEVLQNALAKSSAISW
jgi:hypothetical protein